MELKWKDLIWIHFHKKDVNSYSDVSDPIQPTYMVDHLIERDLIF